MATRKTTKKAPKRTLKKAAKKPARKAAIQKVNKPAAAGMQGMMPSLTANDLQRSVDFYTNLLGFEITDRWEKDGKLLGVMLRAGKLELGVSQDDWGKGRDRKKGQGLRFYFNTTQDVDALAKRIEKRGGVLSEPVADFEWGGRGFSIKDPDGFYITISRM